MKKYKFLCLLFIFFAILGAGGYVYFQYRNNIQTIYDVSTHINPYNNNECVAKINFKTTIPSEITLTIKGKNGSDDINKTFNGYNKEHSIPVIGLYANHNNQVILTAKTRRGKKDVKPLEIQTQRTSNRSFFVVRENYFKNTQYYFLTDGVIYDSEGKIRFSFNDKGQLTYYFNNEIITETRNYGLTRYSMLGEKLQHYPYPEGFTSFTHGIGQKPNKNWLVIGSYKNTMAIVDGSPTQTQRDFIIELDYTTGALVKQWDLAEILNPDRSVIVKNTAKDYGLNDWCHLNGVHYDTVNGGFVISCRNHGVAKVSEDNQLEWLITPNIGLDKSGRDGMGPSIAHKVPIAVNKWGRPYDSDIQNGSKAHPDFKWPTQNHNAFITQGNIVSIFDNSGPIYDHLNVASTPHSVVSIFKINAQKNTIQQIFRHDLDVHTPSASNAFFDDKNNWVHILAANISHDENNGIHYGIIRTYDFDTTDYLFDALYYKGGKGYAYHVTPFFFQ